MALKQSKSVVYKETSDDRFDVAAAPDGLVRVTMRLNLSAGKGRYYHMVSIGNGDGFLFDKTFLPGEEIFGTPAEIKIARTCLMLSTVQAFIAVCELIDITEEKILEMGFKQI